MKCEAKLVLDTDDPWHSVTIKCECKYGHEGRHRYTDSKKTITWENEDKINLDKMRWYCSG